MNGTWTNPKISCHGYCDANPKVPKHRQLIQRMPCKCKSLPSPSQFESVVYCNAVMKYQRRRKQVRVPTKEQCKGPVRWMYCAFTLSKLSTNFRFTDRSMGFHMSWCNRLLLLLLVYDPDPKPIQIASMWPLTLANSIAPPCFEDDIGVM